MGAVARRGARRQVDESAVPGRRSVERADSTDPATWATYERALEASEQADGIGYVFAADDPFVGVDFDDCRDGDKLDSAVAALILHLDSYTERSPSGSGAHVIIRADLNGSRNRTRRTPRGAATSRSTARAATSR